MKKAQRTKLYWKMSSAELDAASADLDAKGLFERARALRPSEAAAHQRAKRKRGRPIAGAGAQQISVTVERRLLKQADARAKKLGLSRARLIAQGLQLVITANTVAPREPAPPGTASLPRRLPRRRPSSAA